MSWTPGYCLPLPSGKKPTKTNQPTHQKTDQTWVTWYEKSLLKQWSWWFARLIVSSLWVSGIWCGKLNESRRQKESKNLNSCTHNMSQRSDGKIGSKAEAVSKATSQRNRKDLDLTHSFTHSFIYSEIFLEGAPGGARCQVKAWDGWCMEARIGEVVGRVESSQWGDQGELTVKGGGNPFSIFPSLFPSFLGFVPYSKPGYLRWPP